MKRNPKANCGNCPYWNHDRGHSGFCQRNAPQYVKCDDLESDWTNTIDNDFCGEHPDFELKEDGFPVDQPPSPNDA